MSAPRVLIANDNRGGAPERAPSTTRAWQIIGVAGWLFLLVGGVDVALAWYPMAFGSPEWEFGTVSATLNGLPLPALGLLATLASASALGKRLWPGLALLFLAGIAVVLMGLLYLLTLPVALSSVTEPLLQSGIKKAAAKTFAHLFLYGVTFLGTGAWLARRPGRSGAAQAGEAVAASQQV